jgi:tRNA pseudouridine38-40 synthase
MQTWKLEIEYDGGRYRGWQAQQNARSVQGELIRAAENALKTRAEIGGAGRTDAGVHALRQVAHLKIRAANAVFKPEHIRFALNDLLPPDINILSVSQAPRSFHARHDAVMRYYLYQISTRRTAFGKPFVWWIKDSLDVAAMQQACALFVGRRDFRSFCESPTRQPSTIVKVETAQIVTDGGLALFRIGASHFLWKMVRRLTGALAEVGRGNLAIADVERLLAAESRETAAWTAPPSGLFLERILYAGDEPPGPPVPAFPIR